MKRLRRLGNFFLNLFRRARVERDLDDEVRAHLDLLTQEKTGQGMNAEQALRAARMELGGVEQVKEEVRGMRAGAWLESLWQDVRFGTRMLRKNPGFTAVVVLTLALGIGANTAIFSFINGTLLRSFPYRDADRLVILWSSNPPRGWAKNIVSPADFADWKSQSHSFEDLAAFEDWSANLAGDGAPQIVDAGRMTSNAFALLGVKPEMGRDFSAAEGRPGAPKVVILSHALWQQNFGGDHGILGKTIRLSGESFTVVGIMPAGFEFPPDYYSAPELWLPLPFDAATAERNVHEFFVFGRLRPGVSMAQAQNEMNLVARRTQQAYPVTDKGWEVSLQTLRESVTEDVRPILLVLLMAVAFVLLIACVNVANLQLSRAVARQKEIAVRTALGAHRTRLVRQFLVESALLSLMGGAAGLLLAYGGIRAIMNVYLVQNPGFEAVAIDSRVLLFTLILSLVTAIFFGIVPALVSSRFDWNRALKEGGRASGVSLTSHRLRKTLVTAEVTLALILLAGAGLLARTFVAVRAVNPGFDPRNVLTFSLPFTGSRYEAQSAAAAFYDRLIPKLKALPGVEAASVITSLPMRGYNGWGFVTEEHPSPPPNEGPDASYQVIAPDYFHALHIPLLRGRTFNDTDQHVSLPVVIINDTLARAYWPGENPLGRRMRIGIDATGNPWRTVVGVVGSIRRLGLDGEFTPEMYVPYTQYPWSNNPMKFVVRSMENPLALVSAVRKAVVEIDSGQAISDVISLQDVVTDSVSDREFNAALAAILAALALLLAAVGVYGSMSYAVSQRAHEFGVRMALGAQPQDIFKLEILRGLKPTLVGIAIGLAGALGLTRLMAKLLFGVRPGDSLTFAAVTGLLLATALLACYVPARRATRIDPMTALRYE